MSDCYLLLAHGSRRESSNMEVRRLALAVSQQLNSPCHAAFLEQAEDAESVLERQLTEHVSQVVVMPYLLAAGRHVTEDIPAILARCQQRWPLLRWRVTRHLGALPGMVELIAATIANPECAEDA